MLVSPWMLLIAIVVHNREKTACFFTLMKEKECKSNVYYKVWLKSLCVTYRVKQGVHWSSVVWRCDADAHRMWAESRIICTLHFTTEYLHSFDFLAWYSLEWFKSKYLLHFGLIRIMTWVKLTKRFRKTVAMLSLQNSLAGGTYIWI